MTRVLITITTEDSEVLEQFAIELERDPPIKPERLASEIVDYLDNSFDITDI
jgi:hypothetical protein